VNTLFGLKADDNTGNAMAALILMYFSHEFTSFVSVLTRERDLR
jgi:hypothetical protein